MSAPEPTTPPPRRRRRTWLLLALLLLAGPLALRFVTARLSSGSRMAHLAARLDRDDPNWRFADLEAAREKVPDPENGALVCSASARLLPSTWPPPALDDLLAGLAPERQLHPAQVEALRPELEHVAPALVQARRLADFPRGRHPLVYAEVFFGTLLTEQTKARTVATLLRYDVLNLAHENKPAEALRSCRALVNTGRTLGDEPFLISQLIRIACVAIALNCTERALAQTQPAEADLAPLQELLAKEEAFNGLLVGLRGERAMNHQLFEDVARGKLPIAIYHSEGPTPPWAKYLGWYYRDRVRAEHPLMLELMTGMVEDAAPPYHEQAAREKERNKELGALPEQARLTKMLLPAAGKVAVAQRRKVASLRCMQALLAAERYRLAKGTWPAKLEELTPAYLKEVPLDPFDGKPLRLKKVPDGFIVYSVGPDATDDGGVLDRQSPARAGSDIGYQLWDPARRRQSAAPPPPPREP